MAADDADRRARIGDLADAIEAEMRRLGVWTATPPSEETVLAGGAFGLGTVPFEYWIQVILVPRLRAVAAAEMAIPEASYVGTQAVREWDGMNDRATLQQLLSELDGVVEGWPPDG